MLKSNKWLLGTVIVVMLYILGHYITLWTMYYMGWYSHRTTPSSYVTEKYFTENVRTIYITGCSNVDIIMADTFYYTIHNSDSNFFARAQYADTLVLQGDTISIDSIFSHKKFVRLDTTVNSFQGLVQVFVTGKERVILLRSDFTIDYSYLPGVFDIYAQRSSAGITTYQYMDSSYPYTIKQLSLHLGYLSSLNNVQTAVTIQNADIRLSDWADIGSLGEGNILAGSITYSDSSQFCNTHGYHLHNLKMIYRRDQTQLFDRYDFFQEDLVRAMPVY
ncbi:MAG: hypothetical protein JNK66_03170 [Chitinophagales bacterium]|nr:hypothetical protein [Chitinophagales bacterium]